MIAELGANRNQFFNQRSHGHAAVYIIKEIWKLKINRIMLKKKNVF